MSEDFPTLSEVGEANLRAHQQREREKRALADREEGLRFRANEYERL
jgi:hypothetical protein